MQQWILYGLIAAFFFGLNVIVLKIAMTRGIGLNPYVAGIASGLGIFLLFLIAFLVKPATTTNWSGVGLAILAGVIWAAGSLMVILAIAGKGDVSRLAPLYNANTLIAVLLGILILKEIPDLYGSLKIIVGAVLITIGAIMVST